MKTFYSWNEFDADVVQIAAWANGLNLRDIYGIPRGGLVLAVALSHQLSFPLVLRPHGISPTTLVVDDISDSGKTLASLEARLGFKPLTVTIFYQRDTVFMPDFYCREKKEWVVFPWETDASSRYDRRVLL